MRTFYRDPQHVTHELVDVKDSEAVPGFIEARRLTDGKTVAINRQELRDETGGFAAPTPKPSAIPIASNHDTRR
jgi:hypothetical protein